MRNEEEINTDGVDTACILRNTETKVLEKETKDLEPRTKGSESDNNGPEQENEDKNVKKDSIKVPVQSAYKPSNRPVSKLISDDGEPCQVMISEQLSTTPPPPTEQEQQTILLGGKQY